MSVLHNPCRPTNLTRFFTTVMSSLPFPQHKAKFHPHLQAAVDVVQRACRLCVDVKTSLFSGDEQILKKNDQTPVTVADFGVQALISLELGRLFPSIPLVAEEDSAYIRSNNLADSVVDAVIDKTNIKDESLTNEDVMEAIDRGGKDASVFGPKSATYWVLDPIDGTKGFLRGSEALYVVGLALIVEGEIVLGVMGCPNWKGTGVVMVAHIGCGTWTRGLSDSLSSTSQTPAWTRCFVDTCCSIQKARFSISDSQTWESLPLSAYFNATTSIDGIGDKQILLLPRCCGSLCKYLMVASGSISVFYSRARARTIIKAWDHAVGMICVHEAGGKVTDWRGSQLDLAADEIERRVIFPFGGILVTNGNLHDEILGLISSASSVV